jgi:CDP-diacylglycerol--glycerol-3-phosphate 3-phosphatidyltransferase
VGGIMKLKKLIPNMLTISRLIVTPFIIYLGIKGNIKLLIIIAIFIALTDFLDGKLARRWNVTSSIGAKLDAIGDKVLAIGLLIVLVIRNHMFFYILLLELLISIFNIYAFKRTKIVESLLVGKIKTWIIFITIILGLLNIIFLNISILVDMFIVLTIIFQLISLVLYIRLYLSHKTKKKN